MKRRLAYCTAIIALAFPNLLHAVIMSGLVESGSGSFIKLTPGFTESNPHNTVGKNTFQTPNLNGFDEAQNVEIASAGLLPDIGAFIAPGTIVASHYIFFDPHKSTSQTGSVSFDANVLGILDTTDSLFATDYLAQNSITYLNPKLRGLESRDKVEFDVLNPMRIKIDWRASSPGDYIRVITETSPTAAMVPDPGNTLIFLGSSLTCLFLACSKHRRTMQSSSHSPD